MHEGEVYFQTERRYITYVVRILEGYEYLGVVTTVDPRLGIARVRATEDTKADVCAVLQSLAIPLQIAERPEDFVKKE